MRTSTIVSLGASALLGIGALVVAKVWLPQSNHTAQKNAAAAIDTTTVPVVVATADIPYGTKIDAHLLTIQRLPISAAPRGAFSDPNQILNQAGGATLALTPISAREAVLPTKLSGGGARPTVAAVIAEGLRAYTIGISDTSGVGGHVLPGDRVDVVLTRELPHINTNGQSDCNCKRVIANIVLQDARVLGIDLNHDPNSTAAAVAHTATLEVAVQDAEKLAVAAQAGNLSLALRRTGNAAVTPVGVIEVKDLGSRPTTSDFQVVSGRVEAVSRHRPEPPRLPQIIPASHNTITVVHGETSATVEVPQERYGAGAS